MDCRHPQGIDSASAELGGAGISQARALQQARQRRALRGLGTAETPLRGGTGGLEIAAQIADKERGRVRPSALERTRPRFLCLILSLTHRSAPYFQPDERASQR